MRFRKLRWWWYRNVYPTRFMLTVDSLRHYPESERVAAERVECDHCRDKWLLESDACTWCARAGTRRLAGGRFYEIPSR